MIPGETALVEFLHSHGKFWFTNCVSILSYSEFRTIPKCSVFGVCGGCSMQHIEYEYQYKLKVEYLKKLLTEADISTTLVEPSYIEDPLRYHYRNRAIIPFRYTSLNNINFGYYKRKSHEIVDIANCPVLDERIEGLIELIYSLVIKTVNNKLHNHSYLRLIRHISLRVGYNTGEILITFISSKKITSELSHISLELLNSNNRIVGIANNVQPKKNNIIFGRKTYTIAGTNFITERLKGIEFKVSPSCFFQINSMQIDKVVDLVSNFFYDSNSVCKIVDAFCGIGTLALPLSKKGFNVVGLEIDETSVELAKVNANLNSLTNIKFDSTDVNYNLNKYLNTDDYLIIDPPRKGINYHCIKTILNVLPRKIAYLSCNPISLCRDLALLVEHNEYQISIIYPLDFFPQTLHLESLVLLERTNSEVQH